MSALDTGFAKVFRLARVDAGLRRQLLRDARTALGRIRCLDTDERKALLARAPDRAIRYAPPSPPSGPRGSSPQELAAGPAASSGPPDPVGSALAKVRLRTRGDSAIRVALAADPLGVIARAWWLADVERQALLSLPLGVWLAYATRGQPSASTRPPAEPLPTPDPGDLEAAEAKTEQRVRLDPMMALWLTGDDRAWFDRAWWLTHAERKALREQLSVLGEMQDRMDAMAAMAGSSPS